ncbi:MAG: patatin-like phospholipase family protein [Cyclobacteriaceae bacterium]|nr:patatin-like phospholipase family protein [Cyclobacteriaceae bacterium]
MNTGLALSGGGARCFSHLGMMQALSERGIEFAYLSATSGGSLVAAFYCAGYSPIETLRVFQSVNLMKLLKPALSWRGLLNLENASSLLASHLPSDFSKLKLPLIVSATNVEQGRVRYFDEGPLIRALLASCAIPLVFDPVVVDGTAYIDGGITDNLPVAPLRKKADQVVAMHCNPIEADFRTTNWKNLMERSLLVSITTATYASKGLCDVFMEPTEVGRYKIFDVKKSNEIYKLGYDYALRQFDENEFLRKIAQV